MEWNAISNLVPASFERIDLNTDSFAKTRGVRSDLLFGDPEIAQAPFLSVVIPTFRRDDLLREAIESVRSQAPVPFAWETLIVDNTPLDAEGQTPALRLVREIGDPSILCYHNRENIGSGYNWNRCAELARGEWIVFLHDDDLLLPHALRNIGRQIGADRGSRPLGYLYARRSEFNGTERPAPSVQARRYPAERLTRFGVLISGCTGAGAPTCGTAILKKAYMETGGVNYDFGPSADEVLCYQIMKHYGVVLSDRVLGAYRWGENESLRPETLLQMIRADELLSAYTYTQGAFARQWGRFFGAASSWRNIRRKRRIAQRCRISIPEEAFCSATDYAEPGKLKKAMFLSCYAAYRLLRLLDGALR